MRNQPGLSWGYDMPINLIRHPKGWLAFFCHRDGSREKLKIFRPKSLYAYYKMIEQVAEWNYGTCMLCPVVKMELD